jgi:hypothetical protein
MIAAQSREAIQHIVRGWLELRQVQGNSKQEELSIDEAVRQIATALRLFGVEPNDYLTQEEQDVIKQRLLG